MMKFLLACLLLCLAPLPSTASEIKAYSGEHEDFTRIVLVFEEASSWSKAETPSGLELQFDTQNASMDLTKIFEKIPKTRVQDVKFDTNSQTLKINTDKDREIEVFSAGRNTIAIDVRNLAEPHTRASKLSRSNLPDAFPLGSPASRWAVTRTPGSKLSTVVAPFPTTFAQAPNEQKALATRNILSLEAALLEQLGRAASQGMATVGSGHSKSQDSNVSRVFQGTLDAKANGQHVSARTAFDFGSEAQGTAELKKVVCFGQDFWDVSSWLLDKDPATAIAMARRTMTSEFDVPSDDSVRRMVQTFLALGFGAEARATIQESDGIIRNEQLFLELSDIVDGHYPNNPNTLEGGESCDDPTSLWAFISVPENKRGSKPNYQAIHASFLRLPLPLRAHIGATLVEKLSLSGNASLATTIRSAISRYSVSSPPKLLMVDAEAAMQRGALEQAMEHLGSAATARGEGSPRAMLKLLNGNRERGTLSENDILDAAAVSFEYRDTALGLALLESAALSWAALGEVEQAIGAWSEVDKNSKSRPSPDRFFSSLTQQIIQKGNDRQIATFIHSNLFEENKRNLDRSAIASAIAWQLKIGDTRQVIQLPSNPTETYSLEDRQLGAELSLQKNDFSLALSQVAAETDPISLHLRAKALSKLGNHGEATRILEELSGDKGEIAREAWLSGDIQQIVKNSTSAQIDFARLNSASTVQTDHGTDISKPSKNGSVDEETYASKSSPPAGINSGKAVLSHSKRTRDLIKALLADIPSPEIH